MNKLIFVAAMVTAMLVAGCSSITGAGASQFGTQALGNLEHCDRTYIGNAGLAPNLSVNIVCHAKPYDKPAVVPLSDITAQDLGQ